MSGPKYNKYIDIGGGVLVPGTVMMNSDGTYPKFPAALGPSTAALSTPVSPIAETTGSVTIASGQMVSTVFDGWGYGSFAIVMPAAFTGTTLSFLGSADGVTYVPIRYQAAASTSVALTVAVSGAYLLPAELSGYRYFKIVSGSAEGADRTIAIIARSIPASPFAGHPMGHAGVSIGAIQVAGRHNVLAREAVATTSGAPASVDGSSYFQAVGPYGYNGATMDAVRNNIEVIGLASAARTATTATADQVNYNGKLVVVMINVSVMASGGLTPAIQGKAATPGTYFQLHANFTKITTTGLYVYVVGLSALTAAAGGITAVAQAPVPRTWRVNMVADDATSITYSVDTVTLV